MKSPDTGSRWQQVNLWCDDWQAAEHVGVTHLGPLLAEAENAGSATSWWFVRKGPSWRLRVLPATGRDDKAMAFLEQAMEALTGHDTIRRWAAAIYEPEIHAFGGADAMDVAHALFHADSRYLLRHLAQARKDHRREAGLLLGSVLMRAAGQDWYEQGDIWAQVAAHRPGACQPPEPAPAAAVHRLITATSGAEDSPLRSAPAWPAAFHRAGQDLADLAQQGSLTRGLRAVLTHHILFAWNRLGISAQQQHRLAGIAGQVVFEQEPAHACGLARGPAGQSPASMSAVTTDTTTADPGQLRAELADYIRARGTFRTAQVEAAFRVVPRHLFLPGTDLQTAYAPQVVITRRAGDRTAISSASHPNLVAEMLEQLGVQQGHRVLEIGAATGINAALLAELAGPAGTVATIEIDDDLAAGARAALNASGYQQVRVICADGANGHPAGAPYDRIIVTAGAWDLAPAWWDQLTARGRLVVPLRLHGSGLTRSIAFDLRQPGRMVSTSAQVCGFVPMRGAAAHAGRSVPLTDDVALHLDASDLADEAALGQALTHPAHEHWTGVEIGDDEPAGHLDLWLATVTSRFARLSAGPAARESGLVTPARRWGGAALYDGGTIAYLAARQRSSDTDELGVIAHGPDSRKCAARAAELLHQWNRDRPAQPVITAQPAPALDDHLPHGHRISRPHTLLTITW